MFLFVLTILLLQSQPPQVDQSRQGIEQLLDVARDEKASIEQREMALNMFRKLGPAGARHAETITDLMLAPGIDDRLRSAAAEAVGGMGPIAVTSAVNRVMRDSKLNDDAKFRILGRLGGDAIVPLCEYVANARTAPLAVRAIADIFPNLGTFSADQRVALRRRVPALAAALSVKTATRDSRERTLAILYHLGADAQGAAPAVTALAVDKNGDVRERAVRTLSRIDSRNPETFAKLLNDETTVVAAAAAWALAGLGESGIAPLAKAISNEKTRTLGVSGASQLLDGFEQNKRQQRTDLPPIIAIKLDPPARAAMTDALPILRTLAATNGDSLQRPAILILAAVGKELPAAKSALLEQLEAAGDVNRASDFFSALQNAELLTAVEIETLSASKNAHAARLALAQLANVPPGDPAKFVQLIISQPPGDEQRRNLQRLFAAGPAAIVAATELLKSKNGELAGAASLFLRKQGDAAAPAVLPLLDTVEPQNRPYVIDAIAGESAKSAIPTLAAIAAKPEQISYNAIAALERIGPAAVPALIDLLSNAYARNQAIDTLKRIQRPIEADARLAELFKGTDPDLAAAAESILGPANPLVAQRALGALRDSKLTTPQREEAAAKMAQTADGINLLLTALKDDDVEVRMAAASGLSAIRGGTATIDLPAAITPAMMPLLDHADPVVRVRALSWLQNGNRGRVPVPAVIKALGDTDPMLRRQAFYMSRQHSVPSAELVVAVARAVAAETDSQTRDEGQVALNSFQSQTPEEAVALRRDVLALAASAKAIDRCTAAVAARCIQQPDDQLKAAIVELSNDAEANVRDQAKATLQKFQR